MATVTYRGVKYDSKEYNAKVLAQAEQARNHDLMYRGLKVVRKVSVKGASKMLVVSEILLASVVFLTLIYAEAQLLYNYK